MRSFFLSDAIASFTKEFPSVALEIEASPQRVDLIADRFDLAIRLGALQDSSLVAKALPSLTRHFYASKNFLKTHGTPISLADLSDLPYLCLQTQGSNSLPLSIPLLKGRATISPRTVIRTNSIGLTRSLAIAGAGIAILPDVMTRLPLVRVLNDVVLAPAEAHFVLPQRQWLPAKTRAFVEHIQSWCERRNPTPPT